MLNVKQSIHVSHGHPYTTVYTVIRKLVFFLRDFNLAGRSTLSEFDYCSRSE